MAALLCRGKHGVKVYPFLLCIVPRQGLCAAQVGLELSLLLQLPECWELKRVPAQPASGDRHMQVIRSCLSSVLGG